MEVLFCRKLTDSNPTKEHAASCTLGYSKKAAIVIRFVGMCTKRYIDYFAVVARSVERLDQNRLPFLGIIHKTYKITKRKDSGVIDLLQDRALDDSSILCSRIYHHLSNNQTCSIKIIFLHRHRYIPRCTVFYHLKRQR
ncbi:MAG: hypothetical protein DIAAKJNI_00569 [Candidatus Argoarchaeum ethanivorans]|uniref:Uncharacterized protein n=1 Tax=Candidatus Argoarchaeum ethanivorans TaxID=2608793 RepID=A0A811TGK3_9EURY|nr:MAG: hypothetical protein DIAAKJNI_00569 [Candidatus Argoarchaeum ethanivorans]